jgi:uncharacterized protein (TIGR03083 family)
MGVGEEQRSAGATAEPAQVAAELWDRVLAEVRGLSGAQWARSTPCSDWDVHDLVGHLSGVQVALDLGRWLPAPAGWMPSPGVTALDQLTATAAAARRAWAPQRLLEELGEARASHVQRLKSVVDWEAKTVGPTGPTTEDALYRTRLYDIWVHLQDLRVALGAPVEADDTSAAAAVAHAFVWERVPWLYAKRARAPEGSTLGFKLAPPLAVEDVVELQAGRARFNPSADPGSCRVEGSPAALTLLVSGRGDPARWRAAGLLDWEGSRGEEFVERARLFR